MQRKRLILFGVVGLCLLAVGAWAQAKKTGEAIEGEIRRASFHYYFGLIFGEPTEYLKGTRMPLYAVHDGVGSYKDEKASRAALAKFAENIKASKVTNDDRNLIVKNMISTFDESSVQFIGANTATLTFLVRHDKKPEVGDYLCTLLLHRADPKAAEWKVIAEVTDSAAVPPEYLK
jgi:hypothetical protein